MHQIIHIGYPKTATTWFRNNFYPNVENYKYFNKTEFRKTFFLKTKNDFLLYIQKELSRNSNYIICEDEIINEKISKNKQAKTVLEKAEILKESFPDAEIIVFIRNQMNILESVYSHYIKEGGSLRFDKLMYQIFKINKIRQWDYYSYLETYINLFGKENTHIYLFEEFVGNFNIFINIFIKNHQLSIDNKNIMRSRINASYKSPVIKLARITNQFSRMNINKKWENEPFIFHIPFLHIASHSFFRKLNRIVPDKRFSAKQHLDKKSYNKLCDYFREGNRKLSEEYNLDLEKYNYPL